MAKSTLFSIVIPVYNNGRELERCLNSINEAVSGYKAEIIVVDDCSPDGGELIESISEKYHALYYRLDANKGPGVARNQGALLAKGDILIFIDADCMAPQEWISKLTNPILKNECVAATSSYCGPIITTWLTIFQNEDYSYRMPAIECDSYFVNSCNLAIERNTFLRFGGFPYERIGEDARLGIILADHGKPARYLPDVGVFHDYHRSLRGYLKQRYSFGFNGFRIILRHDNLMSRHGKQKFRTYNPIRISLGILFAFITFISLFVTGILLMLDHNLYHYFALSTALSFTAWVIVHGCFIIFLVRRHGVFQAVSYLFLQILVDVVYLIAALRGLLAYLLSSKSLIASERIA
jgi:glycosyltransferase involved in cell wall biosynthesis